ncbi:hypothetical protein [Streptomyces sp. NRRL S-118]|nr:hypothetical protein [Streptomyces sp. NRRL S-118]
MSRLTADGALILTPTLTAALARETPAANVVGSSLAISAASCCSPK